MELVLEVKDYNNFEGYEVDSVYIGNECHPSS